MSKYMQAYFINKEKGLSLCNGVLYNSGGYQFVLVCVNGCWAAIELTTSIKAVELSFDMNFLLNANQARKLLKEKIDYGIENRSFSFIEGKIQECIEYIESIGLKYPINKPIE